MSVLISSGGIFDLDVKIDRQKEISLQLQDSSTWQQQDLCRQLNQELSQLESFITQVQSLDQGLQDLEELIDMAQSDNDTSLIESCEQDMEQRDAQLQALEFHRMFSQPNDANNAYIDIQSGSGGTEAQDWAEMLLRMYLRWCDRKHFKSELLECSAGEVAGIKSATIYVKADHAFGWLRTETGVHRLVRKSPFDSGNRRHTSFAAVYVTPELDDSIEI